MKAALHIEEDAFALRMPTGQFTDTVIDGFTVTKAYSTAGTTNVHRWSDDQIARWHVRKARWDRFGRHVARVIRWVGRESGEDGLVQAALRRIGVPIAVPPDRSMMVTEAFIQSDVAALVVHGISMPSTGSLQPDEEA